MSEITPTFHTSKDQRWADVNEEFTPFSKLYPSDKLKEKHAAKIYNLALAATTALQSLKEFADCACDEIIAKVKAENQALDVKVRGRGKGNYRWYNYNRSMRIEVDINEAIVFDDLMIAEAKDLFDEWIKKNVEESLIAEFVTSAFSQNKGKLDTARVLSLVGKIKKYPGAKYVLLHNGVALIEKSISRAPGKKYIRFSVRKVDGSYEYLKLDLASV
jgi:hypothetical protein